MSKAKAFLSHIHAEEELAKLVQTDLLDTNLLSAIEVFVSSDPKVNLSGTSWLNNVEDSLRTAEVILILASPTSINRPWINVEAGAGWVRYLQARADGSDPVAIMPLCHSGLTPGQLPLPWSTFNAVEIRTEGGLQQVLETCARAANIRCPMPNLSVLALEVQRIEQHYMRYREIENRIISVITKLNIHPGMFRNLPPAGNNWVLPQVRQSSLMNAEPDFLWLANQGHIVYSQGGMTVNAGVGTFIDVCFAVTPSFISNVLPNITF